MNKTVRRLLLIFSLICFAGIAITWLSYDEYVCFKPVGQVDNKSYAYGLYLCSEGKNINKEIDNISSFDKDIKSMVSLMDSTQNVEQFIKSGQFDANGINTAQIKSYIVAISKMWIDTKNKKILFTLESGTIKKYFLLSDYERKNLILQVQIKQSDTGVKKLLLAPTSDELSKLIARWQALTGNLWQEMRPTLNFIERIKLVFGYKKFCRNEGYCLYYQSFSIADKSQDSEGALVWKKFIKLIGSDVPLIIGSAMDSRSRKNIELNTDSLKLGPRTGSMLGWLSKLSPVAYLYGDNFIAIFVSEGNEGMPNRQAYLSRASAPIFFVKKSDSEQYIAVDINTSNSFKSFIGKINFIENGDI